MQMLCRDWRGPGEAWVRGEDGWEVARVAATTARPARRRTRTEGEAGVYKAGEEGREGGARRERHRSLPSLQPYSPIVTQCTREVVGFNSLADVLKRLDFRSAVHDIRRFQYVATILKHLLVPDKFIQLSGSSQKFIFRSDRCVVRNRITLPFHIFPHFM